jgi:hypothetical protein
VLVPRGHQQELAHRGRRLLQSVIAEVVRQAKSRALAAAVRRPEIRQMQGRRASRRCCACAHATATQSAVNAHEWLAREAIARMRLTGDRSADIDLGLAQCCSSIIATLLSAPRRTWLVNDVARAAALACRHSGRGATQGRQAAAEHQRAVRHQGVLDRKIRERAEQGAQMRWATGGLRPRLRAHPELAGLSPNHCVSEYQRSLPR